ncbi:MAG: TonB-dependent siderophore receptor [Mitsuaria chitosanitabida]|uniref:TonB-dependent siderophore receptor n=1 Tax=Roseateles chitosanitabidus TaxID=65048 RepID=UPI001B01D6F1|nr:TonB-dependent siderophore receptor [Roseateles chitosanitabidus]MBO9685993.1 TonB-dependent siderophore receptor [Roseateles chitosanitabidus]
MSSTAFRAATPRLTLVSLSVLSLLAPLSARAQSAEVKPAPSGAATASTQVAVADATQKKLLDEVVVSGERKKTFAPETVRVGAFRDQDPLDVPLTNAVMSRELLDAQGAQGLFDALKNTAGVTRSQVSGSTYDNLSIRGIVVENRGNYRLNGSLPIVNLIDIPLENKEQVEVLKGASSMYYGMVPPSGIVNFVTKRAGPKPVTSLTTTINDHGGVKTHVDIGRRFGTDDSMGLRVNAAAGKEETGIDRYKGDRNLVTLAYDWRATPWANFKVDLERYRKNVSEQAGIQLPAAVNGVITLPRVPDNKTNLAGDWARYDAHATNALVRGDFAVNDNWVVSLETGRAKTDRDRNFSTFQNYNKDTGAGTLSTTVLKGQAYTNTNHRVEAIGRFDTLGLSHELTLGASYNRRESAGWQSAVVTASQNLYAPVDVAPVSPTLKQAGYPSEIRDRGLYVFDRVAIGEQWQVLAGLRKTDYRSLATNPSAPTTVFKADKVTPNFSLMWKPMKDLSVYGSVLRGLEETGTAPLSASNAGEVLAPAVSKQHELGVKARVGSVLLQTAAFQIERALTTTVNGVYQVGGQSRYRGIEFSASGEIGRDFAVVASATVLDAEITRVGTTNPLELGKTPENTPKNTLSLFGEYRVPMVPGLALNAGVYHVGKRAVNNANQGWIDAYETLSLGARYATTVLGKPLSLQANLDNATNKDYWSTAGNNLLGVGAPRTLRVTAKVDF